MNSGLSEFGAGLPQPQRLVDHDTIVLQQLAKWNSADSRIFDLQGQQIGHVSTGGSSTSRVLLGVTELYVSDAAGPVLHVVLNRPSLTAIRFDFFTPDNRQIGHVQRRTTMFKAGYDVFVHDGTVFLLERRALAYDITITLGGALAGHARQKPRTFSEVMVDQDQYTLSFDPGAPPLHRMAMLAGVLSYDIAEARG